MPNVRIFELEGMNTRYCALGLLIGQKVPRCSQGLRDQLVYHIDAVDV